MHNHPFCAVCGSHQDLLVERDGDAPGHMVVSTVTGTIHEVEVTARPRVVCASCHANHEASFADAS